MNEMTNRREFLSTSWRAGLALATAGALVPTPGPAMEPFKRPGKPRFPLSLAAYSFREFFNHKDPAKRLTLFQFIDFCADQGLEGAELTSYYFPPKADAEFLLQVKRHAFLRGVAISGTAIGNNYCLPKGEKRDAQIALTKQWVDNAALLGAPHIRVFAGAKGALDLAEAKKLCLETLEECADYAGKKGVFLGLENHGGIVAEPADLLGLVQAAKSPWVGINLDSGNFNTDDPYADLAKCAPYAVNVQIKVEIKRRGAAKRETTDLDRITKFLRDANYQGFVALEYEAAEDPWQAVPVWLKRMRAAVVP
ncbi:MAG: sugar phosphate isomerase/epimerase [Verrucomicrobia bacterium]|nr:sugar phosphate isomerase/epimerase [Verrucomicrobiota bacterium]